MENILDNLDSLSLPNRLWGIHVHPNLDFVGILHLSVVDMKDLHIDKGLLVHQTQGQIQAAIFLEGREITMENTNCDKVTIKVLEELIQKLEEAKLCKNIDYGTECMQFTLKDSSFCEKCSPSCDNIKTENEDEIVLIEYCCSECGKSYSDEALLKEHQIKSHNTENQNTESLNKIKSKNFQCSYCHKSFLNSQNLMMHENTHLGIKPYMCKQCDKSFAARTNLRIHVLHCHENARKYACEICGMRFVLPKQLRRHMVVHDEDKPYKCDECGAGFGQNGNLKIHMLRHYDIKPHMCERCSRGFRTTGNLSRHKKNCNIE